MALSNEEIQAVKDSGKCHDVDLVWALKTESTTEYVAAICDVCFTEFRKSKPTPINLD